MSKRFTKIICTAVAAFSVSAMAFLPACKTEWEGISGPKDTSAYVAGTNGGFVTETQDYVYFINGKAANTDSNDFGSVLKGSVQRIKKTDLSEGNFSKTDTVVPSVVYANSSSVNAGIYIYNNCIYYTTPSSDVDSDGDVLNGILEFKRTTLDGSSTSGNFWSTDNLSVDYRFVQPEDGGDVYILYALSENLYGTSATNIHSVNCNTGANTILAYNVTSYAFDTVDATNPYVYYTMKVPQYVENDSPYDYNQLYMVRADAKTSPREYEGVDGDHKYINYGTHVFDGISALRYKSGDVNQFNYAYGSEKEYNFNNADLTFTIKWFKNDTLYYTIKENSNVTFHRLTSKMVDGDDDGKVDEGWDAMTKAEENKKAPLVSSDVTTEYEFVTVGEKLYAVYTSSGVKRSLVKDGKIGEEITIPAYKNKNTASAMLFVKEEADGHQYLYYSATGGNGYTVNRVAIDGEDSVYTKLPTTPEPDLTYRGVSILDLDACSNWYKPEFVDGRWLFFASETEGMSSYNYIMTCDLKGENGIMSNKEIYELTEKFEGIEDKIKEYDDEKNADGSAAYANLSSALTYLYNTGDVDYIDRLINAYVDIEGRDKEYVYSEASVQKYKDFAAAEGDWADYKADEKTVNGKTVYSNSREYYYSVVGRMEGGHADALKSFFKSAYMESYPTVETYTWWEKLSTGGKFGAVFGIVEGCMLVIGGGVVLVAWLVTRKKTGGRRSEKAIKVDLTDDKDVDVYGENEE